MKRVFVLGTLLALAACNTDRTVGQNLDRAVNTTGSAVGSAADATGRTLERAGTATRDTLDPPRGPAERAGRATDRTTGARY